MLQAALGFAVHTLYPLLLADIYTYYATPPGVVFANRLT